VRLAHQVSQGLTELHASRILYQDLKPANVLLDGDGNAVLADFGLSRTVGDASKLYATRASGTVPFM